MSVTTLPLRAAEKAKQLDAQLRSGAMVVEPSMYQQREDFYNEHNRRLQMITSHVG